MARTPRPFSFTGACVEPRTTVLELREIERISRHLAHLLATKATASVILIRVMVGLVFLSEGLQKFLDPAHLGPGRFEKMGFTSPEVTAYFVACFEVTCGALLTLGFLTRLAAIPLIIVMLTALVTTNLPILVGHDLWGFHVRKLSEYGFWAMAHEARTDWSMLLGCVFLLIVGGGRWSIDARLTRDGPTSPPAGAGNTAA